MLKEYAMKKMYACLWMITFFLSLSFPAGLANGDDDGDEGLNKMQKLMSAFGKGAQGAGKRMQDAYSLMTMLRALKILEANIELERDSTKKQAMTDIKNNIYGGLKSISQGNFPAKIGRVIANAIAGKNLDESVDGVGEGIVLGIVSRSFTPIRKELDRAIGNTVESVSSKIGDVCTAVYEDFFHDGQQPFNAKYIKGWKELIDGTFGDLDRALRDGIKDSMRGRDMTLREQDEPEVASAQQQQLTAWIVLVGGYVRQFEYVANQIDKRLAYYHEEEDETIFYFAGELKQRLLEVAHILKQSKSLRDFDSFLESNKALIPAFKKNIANLFARLNELVEPKTSTSYSTGGSLGKDSMSHKDSKDDDDDATHSFNGWS